MSTDRIHIALAREGRTDVLECRDHLARLIP